MVHHNMPIGFIGGGRVTRIILSGLSRRNALPAQIAVYDIRQEQMESLASDYSAVRPVASPAELVSASRMIFLAVHPPEVSEILRDIGGHLDADRLVVSLAPKINFDQMFAAAGKSIPLIRVIPNAPSAIDKGYNVYAIPPHISGEHLQQVSSLFTPLGEFREVDETLLEAYATLTGMGPTYLWFLFQYLYRQAIDLGIEPPEARQALNTMIAGTSDTLFNSGMTYEQVLDLIPGYPLRKYEDNITSLYREVITGLYEKLSSKPQAPTG